MGVLLTVWGFLTGNLWRTAFLAAVAFGGVQTWRVNSWKAQAAAEVAAHEKTKKDFVVAALQADVMAREFKADVEAAYRKRAKEADENARKRDQRAQRSLTDFIIANRVQDNGAFVGSATGEAAAASGNNGAGRPEDMSAATILVSESDLRACTNWVTYGLTAREWALSLETVGREVE